MFLSQRFITSTMENIAMRTRSLSILNDSCHSLVDFNRLKDTREGYWPLRNSYAPPYEHQSDLRFCIPKAFDTPQLLEFCFGINEHTALELFHILCSRLYAASKPRPPMSLYECAEMLVTARDMLRTMLEQRNSSPWLKGDSIIASTRFESDLKRLGVVGGVRYTFELKARRKNYQNSDPISMMINYAVHKWDYLLDLNDFALKLQYYDGFHESEADQLLLREPQSLAGVGLGTRPVFSDELRLTMQKTRISDEIDPVPEWTGGSSSRPYRQTPVNDAHGQGHNRRMTPNGGAVDPRVSMPNPHSQAQQLAILQHVNVGNTRWVANASHQFSHANAIASMSGPPSAEYLTQPPSVMAEVPATPSFAPRPLEQPLSHAHGVSQYNDAGNVAQNGGLGGNSLYNSNASRFDTAQYMPGTRAYYIPEGNAQSSSQHTPQPRYNSQYISQSQYNSQPNAQQNYQQNSEHIPRPESSSHQVPQPQYNSHYIPQSTPRPDPRNSSMNSSRNEPGNVPRTSSIQLTDAAQSSELGMQRMLQHFRSMQADSRAMNDDESEC